MRVVAATPQYPPTSRVGAWLATHEFLAAMVRRGHQVDVVVYMYGGESFTHDGVSVHSRHRDLAVGTADVVVSHLGDNGQAHAAAIAAGVPSVRMVHGRSSTGGESTENAALVVFNSHASAAEWPTTGPSVVCHPPVWQDRYQTTPGDSVTLVNLIAPKGGELLPILASCCRDWPFLGVAGCYGRQIRRPGLNLTLLPPTENMRDDVYARTRVLLMPSEHETWGMVGVEAMCSGIPVIAHPTPGLVESLGDAGIFVDRGDLDGWIAALRTLADPTEWETASLAAKTRAAELDPQHSVDLFCTTVEGLV